jgi:hypothetical protein
VCGGLLVQLSLSKKRFFALSYSFAHFSVIVPFLLTFLPGQYRFPDSVGNVLLPILTAYWFVAFLTFINSRFVVLGLTGLVTFALHLFLLQNLP